MATWQTLRREIAVLALAAMGTGATAAAQNLIVGPGAVVLHQYRPGVGLYAPNTYGYALPNPYQYIPLTGRRFPVYAPPVQPYVAPPTSTYAAPSYTPPANPYREYYTPHIPRYHRKKDSEKTQSTTVVKPVDTTGASQGSGANAAEPPERTPAPSEPERVETQKPESSGSNGGQTDPPRPAERTRRSPRRKPVRYR